MKKILLLLTLCFSFGVNANSFISLESDQGDFIGSGQTQTLTGDFFISIDESRVFINHESGFNFSFDAPDDRTLEIGTYLSAERSPFRGSLNPGIEVTSSGRGCNTIDGEFYIYEIENIENAPVIALDFIQFCDSNSERLKGSIRLNTDVLDPYPFPYPIVSGSSSLINEGDDFILSAAKSFSNTSTISRFFWEQVSGPEVNISDSASNNININILDDINLGGEDVVLNLTIVDDLGQSESISHLVTIRSKSDPQTFLTMSSETGDFIGAGREWFYDLSTSLISAFDNFDNGVSISIAGSEFWSIDFAAPNREQLQVASYDNAERFPFQSSGSAGLTVSGNGRGCNMSFGNFNVSRLTFQNNEPIEFRATFEQHCESIFAPLLSGEISINAIDENVPTANAGTDILINELDIVNLNGSDSIDIIGNITSYAWTASNEIVVIESADQSRANFIAPALPDKIESENMQISLLVTDNEGFKAVDVINITVFANNSAPVSTADNFEVLIGSTSQLTPLNNDIDNDGRIDLDTIEIIQEPTNGTITISSQGVIEYTHTQTEILEDTIIYTVQDNDGAVSNESVIRLEAIKEPETSSSSGGTINYWLFVFILIVFRYRKGRTLIYL